jgi:hypothetical protein
MSSLRALFALLLLLGGTVSGVARAELAAVAYGADGELFELHRGTYATLFPGGSDGVDPEHSVLRLDVTRAGQRSRYLVPETDGFELEGEASLVYEAASERLFVLWGSWVDPILSSLYLASFANGNFADPIEVSGDPVPLKGPPRLAVTRDAYGVAPMVHPRTVVHLLWWEEGESGAEAVFYTPIVLLDGAYLGWNPVLPLHTFDPNLPQTDVAPSELYTAANIEPGRDERSVVVTLPRRSTGRILTVEIRLLPYALMSVADDARVRIPGFGSHITNRSTVELADEIRAHVASRLGPLHTGVLRYLADEAHAAVLAHGETFDEAQLDQIASSAWDAILGGGASLVGREVEASSPTACQIVHLGADVEDDASQHQLELCRVSDRAAPPVGPGPVTVWASENGTDVLVLWEEDSQTLRYTVSDRFGWSEPHTADLGGSLDPDAARAYLRQLIRPR